MDTNGSEGLDAFSNSNLPNIGNYLPVNTSWRHRMPEFSGSTYLLCDTVLSWHIDVEWC